MFLRTLSVLVFVVASHNCLSQSWQEIQAKAASTLGLTQITSDEFLSRKAEASLLAKQKGLPLTIKLADGKVAELISFEYDRPQYYISTSAQAAQTIRTNSLWSGGSLGLQLNGSGQVIGEWDEARVRGTHRELLNRVTQVDNPTSFSNHSTHCAGTMMSTGVLSTARGMSNQSTLLAHDWNNDQAEMRTAAASGLKTSNHSYGYIVGWFYNLRGDGKWCWLGNPTLSQTSDYQFGYYSSASQQWDNIARDYPNYLICKAAGNDRGEGPVAGTEHWVWTNGAWVLSTATRDKDGGNTGFDCIEGAGLAKNVLTVGAVQAVSSYVNSSSVVMSWFSGFGPTDDGRIKPDIVSQGVSVQSAIATHDSAYASWNGTSMATPSVCGSISLLHQYYQSLKPNSTPLKASTIKGLIIHTADEAGDFPGPDYRFGWGLMNTERAATVIASNCARSTNWEIRELNLTSSQVIEIQGVSNGNQPIKATISWTDPAGNPVAPAHNSTTKMLVNDVDVKILRNSTTYLPYILNPSQPSAAATTGNNNIDNVEQVYIAQPSSGNYTIRISAKNSIVGTSQVVSLIISGLQPLGVTSFAGNDQTVCSGSAAVLSGTGTVSSGTIQYKWYNYSTGQLLGTSAQLSVTPLQNTTYRFVVSNGTDSSFDDLQVNVVANSSVNAGNDQTITQGQSVTLQASVQPTTSIVTWRRVGENTVLGNGTSIQITPIQTANYVAEAVNGGQCVSRDTIKVTVVQPTVVANAGTDKSICSGVSTSLIGSGTGYGQLAYQWKNISTGVVVSNTNTATVAPLNTTAYVLKVTDANLNSAFDTITVLVVTPTSLQTPISSASPCKGNAVQYTASNPPVGSTYTWTITNGSLTSVNSTNKSCVVTWSSTASIGIIKQQVQTSSGCIQFRSDTLQLINKPVPSFTSANSCVGQVVTYTSNNSNFSNNWSIGTGSGGTIVGASNSTSVQVQWSTEGSKSVTLSQTNTQGCTGVLTKSPTVNPLPNPVISVNNSNAPRVGQQRTYSVANLSGRSRTWSVVGGQILSGQGTRSITVQWQLPSSGSVTVNETINQTGCSKSTSLAVVVAQRQSIENEEETDAEVARVYPNPVKQQLSLIVPIQGVEGSVNLKIQVSSIDGKTIRSESYSVEEGMFSTLLDVSNVPSGSYMVHVTYASTSLSIPFIKY